MVTTEFALVCATLFMLVVGLLDVGRYVLTATSLSAATGEVVRAAMADRTGPACTNPEGFALTRVAALNPALLTVTADCSRTDRVQITMQYEFSFVLPFLGTAPRTLRTDVTLPI